MPIAFAMLTSDPNLLSCDLHRLEGQVLLSPDERRRAVGVGSYAQDEVLLQRHQPDSAPRSVEELVPRHPTEVLLFHAARLPPSRPLDGGTQPLRYRHWLFCLSGSINGFAELAPKLMDEVPDHLRRTVVQDTEQEVAFALFLTHLRDAGRTDDPGLDTALAARLLNRTAQRIQQAAAEAGAARTSSFALLATNQRLLLACRSGDQPLSYRPLEGTDRCDHCGLTEKSPEPRLRAHSRRRAVAVATDLVRPSGWVALGDGEALAVDGQGQLHVERGA